MPIRETIPDLRSLRQINGDNFNHADYVNFLANISDSPLDVAVSFSSVFFPVVSIIDGIPFNESTGSYHRYLDNLDKGMVELKAYYWCHVTDIEGLFKIDRVAADKIADRMCIGWNAAFQELGICNIHFRKVVDEEIILEPVIQNLEFRGHNT